MKRLFTFALAALITATAFAQSQPAQRRVVHTQMHQAVRTNRIDKAAKAEALAKAEAADEVGFSRLVRKGKHTASGQKLTLNERTLFVAPAMRIIHESRHNSPAKVTETEGNLTITKDWHGIITDVTGVEARYYNREGQAFYYSDGSVGLADQAGKAKLVIDGNNVYWHEPVSRLTDGCWIKGIKEGNTITFATHQPMEYVMEDNTTISARWVSIAANGQVSTVDDHADSFTFVIDGDVITFQGSQVWDEGSDIYLMGAVWDDDNSFTGFGDAGTVLTLDTGYTPPSTELVTLPAGVTPETWYCNGIDLGEGGAIRNKAVNVAFTDNDVYVQRLFDEFPSAWIKGTKNGNIYVFDMFQYIGHYDYSMPIWAVGADPVTEELTEATATYDASAKTLTFNTDLVANAAEDRIYYVNWIAYVMLSADEVEYPEPVLNDLTATLPYVNTFDSKAEMDEVAIYDANEDGKTFVFANDPTGGDYNIAACYTYHYSNAADDYLVFPAVKLEAGKTYSVSIDARAQGTLYPERVSVVCGKESKVSALTTEIIAPTTVTSADVYVNLANNAFTVSESGMYTIAVKACSDRDEYQLWVDNFSVKSNVTDVPAAATDLAVVADAGGANKATVTVTAPTKKLDGTALEADLAMTISVDEVKAIERSVAPGASVSEEISFDASGFHTVSVVFANDRGSGDAVSAKAYIGVDVPAAPTAFTLADKSSAVGMSWTAPTAGENGGVVFPDRLKYNVYPVTLVESQGMVFPVIDYANPYATGISRTSYDLPFNTNEGEMDFTYFAVAAENESGLGDGAFGAVVTGAPYSLPVKESVANQQLSYFWEVDCDDMNYNLEAGLGVGQNPSDGDGWNFRFLGKDAGYATLESGKIALKGSANPVVKFDAVNTLGNSTLEVYVTSPAGKTLVKTITPGAVYADYTISLADYKDADWVRVAFTGVFTGTGNYEDPIAIIDLDNIRIVNIVDHNLSAMSLSAPATVAAGKDIVATATVKNRGGLAVAGADYTVKFTVNGEEYIVDGVDLAPEAQARFAYTVATNVASAAEYVFKAEVVYAADEDLSDNATSEVTVKVVRNKYPTVSNVVASMEGSAVVLNWEEPDLDVAPEAVTEDFESYEPFQFGNSIGDWTLVDGDGKAMGGLQDSEIPNLTLGVTTGSFFVLNRETISEHNSFDAVSGVQYLSTMFTYQPAYLDDWIISPALSGEAQTISFFARSYSGSYPESFQVLCSTTDKATGSFFKVSGDSDIVAPQAWTEYTFDLPEGAKYFAIRCTSYDKFMFFVDDITYIPASIAGDLEIVGYNVYRNGVKVNEEPVAETGFTDESSLASDTTYSYGVSVVYTQGESPVVNADITTGVDSIDAEADGAIYYNMQGVRVAKPAKGEAVIRMVDGKATKTIVR